MRCREVVSTLVISFRPEQTAGRPAWVRPAFEHQSSWQRLTISTYLLESSILRNFAKPMADGAALVGAVPTSGADTGANLRMKLKSYPATCALPWQPMHPPILAAWPLP